MNELFNKLFFSLTLVRAAIGAIRYQWQFTSCYKQQAIAIFMNLLHSDFTINDENFQIKLCTLYFQRKNIVELTKHGDKDQITFVLLTWATCCLSGYKT